MTTEERKTVTLYRWTIAVLILAFVLSALAGASIKGDLTEAENDYAKLRREHNDSLYALGVARRDQVRWLEMCQKIDNVRGLGFSPDSLVVATIVEIRERFPSVGALVDSVAQYESSWGYNKKNGLIGEKGWAQYRPETFCYIVYGLGGDTVGLHEYVYRNSLDIRSVTEFFYATATIARMLNNGAFYANWNRGMFARIKKRSDYKAKPLGRHSIR